MKSINHHTQKTVNFISKGPHLHLMNFCFFCETVISSVSQARMAIFFLQALPVFKGAVIKSDIFVNSHVLDLKENVICVLIWRKQYLFPV